MDGIAHDLSDRIDALVRAGRTPYRIDFTEPGYDTADQLGRFVDFHQPNTWCSRSLINPDLHLPCLDVDTDRATAQHLIEAVFQPFVPAVEQWLWLPSSTEGHWHAYLDWPIAWPVYLSLLEQLDGNAIETGYLIAARKRKATFVRMPGVVKEPTAPKLPIPPAVAALYGDEEPF